MKIGGWLRTAVHFCRFPAYMWSFISHTAILFIYFAERQRIPVHNCHASFLKTHSLIVLTVFHKTCAVIVKHQLQSWQIKSFKYHCRIKNVLIFDYVISELFCLFVIHGIRIWIYPVVVTVPLGFQIYSWVN